MNKFLKLYAVGEQSEALQKAMAHFSCTEQQVFTSVLEEGHPKNDETGEPAQQWLFLTAYTGEGGVVPSNINADFNVFFESDGVYLETYAATGHGDPLDTDKAVEYIRRKSIDMIDTSLAQDLLRSGKGGREKIAPAQEEKILSEDLAISVSKDEMEGCIRFLPPDEGGGKLTVMQISEKLKEAGIVFGISPISLGEANREKNYNREYVVAKGVLPENGVDGEVTYHFERFKETGKPSIDEKGYVHYKDLNLFERVKAGQLLITRTLATQGKPGSTVTGREIAPKAGREANLPRTKNITVNEEKTEAHAAVSGMVEVLDGAICVSNTYTVKEDCDLSTGNIDFDGNVVIVGAVISGMQVRASGDITVGGVVNEAELIAEGNIELKRGIQGNDKGRLIAAGSITAVFIERAEVHAKADVIADVIMHSTIEAGGELLVKGKRGNLVGGKTLVGSAVVAKTIGAPSHVQTEVEVGLLPEKKARMKVLRDELEKLAKEEAKIAQIELYLSRADNLPDEKRKTLTESVAQTRAQTVGAVAGYKKELEELQYAAEHATDGAVHCSVVTYPGSKITIGTGVYRVDEQTRTATFKYKNGKVAMGACERYE